LSRKVISNLCKLGSGGFNKYTDGSDQSNEAELYDTLEEYFERAKTSPVY
jgi:hypothetical protein